MPSEWNLMPLSACAKFQEGYVNPYQRNPEYFGPGHKWLRATDLNDGFVEKTSRTLTEAGFQSAGKSAQLFKPGTLAISKSGTIGRMGILKDYMCGNRAVINIAVNETCDTRFIFYSLLTRRKEIETLAEGSVQKNLYISVLGKLELLLPSLDEQKAIVETLGSLDDKIALLRQTNATLEAIAQALFKSWFVDFDPVRAKAEGRDPEGVLPEVADLFPSEFEDSELGEIPKGWRVGKLGEISRNLRVGAKPEELTDDTAYIGLEHMPRQSIALEDWESASKVESGKSRFRKGQILFGKLRPYFHKVGIAPLDGVCSTDILVIEPALPAWHAVCVCHYSSKALVEHATQLSNGAKMPRTNWSDLANYRVAVPPDEVAQAFEDIVSPLLERIPTNVHQAKALAETRDALLPRLMSGKLSIDANTPSIEVSDA